VQTIARARIVGRGADHRDTPVSLHLTAIVQNTGSRARCQQNKYRT